MGSFLFSIGFRMFCSWVCQRFFEPVRDVSFINNVDERILIQDFINACDTAAAWRQIRRGTVSEYLRSKIEDALVYKHDFVLMIQLMGRMATDWDSWVANRKLVQEKEESDAAAVAKWSSKYKWNSNANDVLLLAYMENLLTLGSNLTNPQLTDKILFQLEISLARKETKDMEAYKNFLEHVDGDDVEAFQETMEYKMEICKLVTAIPLPKTYKFTKERWAKNKEYIESCESMKKVLGDLQEGIITQNNDILRKALQFSETYPLLHNTTLYIEAEAMLAATATVTATAATGAPQP